MQKLKVLHVFKSYLPSTENWIYLMLKYCKGVEQYIAAERYLKNNFYLSNAKYLEHPFGEIRLYASMQKKSLPLELFKKILSRIAILISGGFNSELYKFAKINEVDIIHAHFADVAWGCRKVPLQLGLPLVISFYGWDYEKLPFLKPAFKQHYKKLFKQAKMIICEGPHGAKILEKAGCPTSKLRVVRSGVETEKIPFFIRSKKVGELKLVQVATFTEKKGHVFTVLAFKEALKDCPNMQLTLIGGDGGQKGKILQLIKEYNLEEFIFVEDRIEWSNLHERLKDFQIFIHPSCYAADMDCEGGAPIVLLDAQATGMPVISTLHCDIPEEVIDGATGFLTEEKDIKQLNVIIKFFYHLNNNDYYNFCIQTRKNVEVNFNISEIYGKLENEYLCLGEKEVEK